MSQAATINTDDYMRDACGNLISKDNIKEIDLARHGLVREIALKAKDLSTAIAEFKGYAMGDIDAFVDLSAERYEVKLGGKKVTGRVSAIDARIDVNTLEASAASELKLNEIGRVTVALNAAAAFDAYTACRGTGGFIIVDRISNATAAAGMVIDAVADASQHSDADELARLRAFEVELNALVRRYFPHWEAKDIVSKLG